MLTVIIIFYDSYTDTELNSWTTMKHTWRPRCSAVDQTSTPFISNCVQILHVTLTQLLYYFGVTEQISVQIDKCIRSI